MVKFSVYLNRHVFVMPRSRCCLVPWQHLISFFSLSIWWRDGLLTRHLTADESFCNCLFLISTSGRLCFFTVAFHRSFTNIFTQIALITKPCLYNVDPLKPHFYIVKLGFTGVYIIFLIPAKNIDCGYSLEPPRRGGLTSTSIYVLSRNMKNIRIFIWKLSFFGGKIFSIFE